MTTIIVILLIIAFSTGVYAVIDKSRALHLFSGWLCMLTALIAGAVPEPWGGTIIAMFVFGTISLYLSYKGD